MKYKTKWDDIGIYLTADLEKEDGSSAYCKQLLIPNEDKPLGLMSYSSEAGVAGADVAAVRLQRGEPG